VCLVLTVAVLLFSDYSYLQLGCSKQQEKKMLHFARACIGKPFSQAAMARSLVWPRMTHHRNYFCAGTRLVFARHSTPHTHASVLVAQSSSPPFCNRAA
jgi:hypothetical protein